ncbi:MAG: NADH-quinone oxidoreductase subunit H [Thermomicrobiales bacterium]
MDPLLLLLQLLMLLAFAPLLQGMIKTTKARWQGRRGPGLLQPYWDLAKLFTRESVVSDHASWISRGAPAVYAAAIVAAAVLIPTVARRSAAAGIGDIVVFVGLLALARFAISLAALDTASNFGGMGASREVAFAALIEPALLIVLFAVALPVGSTSFSALVTGTPPGAGALLGFGALLIVAIAETGRIPIDNPDTHLELTMIHEGMVLEQSGRPLGIVFWASQIKQFAMLALIAALFLPWGMAAATDRAPLALLGGAVALAAKVAILGLLLATIESGLAKLRIFQAPYLLGFASILGILAVLFTSVIAR